MMDSESMAAPSRGANNEERIEDHSGSQIQPTALDDMKAMEAKQSDTFSGNVDQHSDDILHPNQQTLKSHSSTHDISSLNKEPASNIVSQGAIPENENQFAERKCKMQVNAIIPETAGTSNKLISFPENEQLKRQASNHDCKQSDNAPNAPLKFENELKPAQWKCKIQENAIIPKPIGTSKKLISFPENEQSKRQANYKCTLSDNVSKAPLTFENENKLAQRENTLPKCGNCQLQKEPVQPIKGFSHLPGIKQDQRNWYCRNPQESTFLIDFFKQCYYNNIALSNWEQSKSPTPENNFARRKSQQNVSDEGSIQDSLQSNIQPPQIATVEKEKSARRLNKLVEGVSLHKPIVFSKESNLHFLNDPVDREKDVKKTSILPNIQTSVANSVEKEKSADRKNKLAENESLGEPNASSEKPGDCNLMEWENVAKNISIQQDSVQPNIQTAQATIIEKENKSAQRKNILVENESRLLEPIASAKESGSLYSLKNPTERENINKISIRDAVQPTTQVTQSITTDKVYLTALRKNKSAERLIDPTVTVKESDSQCLNNPVERQNFINKISMQDAEQPHVQISQLTTTDEVHIAAQSCSENVTKKPSVQEFVQPNIPTLQDLPIAKENKSVQRENKLAETDNPPEPTDYFKESSTHCLNNSVERENVTEERFALEFVQANIQTSQDPPIEKENKPVQRKIKLAETDSPPEPTDYFKESSTHCLNNSVERENVTEQRFVQEFVQPNIQTSQDPPVKKENKPVQRKSKLAECESSPEPIDFYKESGSHSLNNLVERENVNEKQESVQPNIHTSKGTLIEKENKSAQRKDVTIKNSVKEAVKPTTTQSITTDKVHKSATSQKVVKHGSEQPNSEASAPNNENQLNKSSLVKSAEDDTFWENNLLAGLTEKYLFQTIRGAIPHLTGWSQNLTQHIRKKFEYGEEKTQPNLQIENSTAIKDVVDDSGQPEVRPNDSKTEINKEDGFIKHDQTSDKQGKTAEKSDRTTPFPKHRFQVIPTPESAVLKGSKPSNKESTTAQYGVQNNTCSQSLQGDKKSKISTKKVDKTEKSDFKRTVLNSSCEKKQIVTKDNRSTSKSPRSYREPGTSKSFKPTCSSHNEQKQPNIMGTVSSKSPIRAMYAERPKHVEATMLKTVSKPRTPSIKKENSTQFTAFSYMEHEIEKEKPHEIVTFSLPKSEIVLDDSNSINSSICKFNAEKEKSKFSKRLLTVYYDDDKKLQFERSEKLLPPDNLNKLVSLYYDSETELEKTHDYGKESSPDSRNTSHNSKKSLIIIHHNGEEHHRLRQYSLPGELDINSSERCSTSFRQSKGRDSSLEKSPVPETILSKNDKMNTKESVNSEPWEYGTRIVTVYYDPEQEEDGKKNDLCVAKTKKKLLSVFYARIPESSESSSKSVDSTKDSLTQLFIVYHAQIGPGDDPPKDDSYRKKHSSSRTRDSVGTLPKTSLDESKYSGSYSSEINEAIDQYNQKQQESAMKQAKIEASKAPGVPVARAEAHALGELFEKELKNTEGRGILRHGKSEDLSDVLSTTSREGIGQSKAVPARKLSTEEPNLILATSEEWLSVPISPTPTRADLINKIAEQPVQKQTIDATDIIPAKLEEGLNEPIPEPMSDSSQISATQSRWSINETENLPQPAVNEKPEVAPNNTDNRVPLVTLYLNRKSKETGVPDPKFVSLYFDGRNETEKKLVVIQHALMGVGEDRSHVFALPSELAQFSKGPSAKENIVVIMENNNQSKPWLSGKKIVTLYYDHNLSGKENSKEPKKKLLSVYCARLEGSNSPMKLIIVYHSVIRSSMDSDSFNKLTVTQNTIDNTNSLQIVDSKLDNIRMSQSATLINSDKPLLNETEKMVYKLFNGEERTCGRKEQEMGVSSVMQHFPKKEEGKKQRSPINKKIHLKENEQYLPVNSSKCLLVKEKRTTCSPVYKIKKLLGKREAIKQSLSAVKVMNVRKTEESKRQHSPPPVRRYMNRARSNESFTLLNVSSVDVPSAVPSLHNVSSGFVNSMYKVCKALDGDVMKEKKISKQLPPATLHPSLQCDNSSGTILPSSSSSLESLYPSLHNVNLRTRNCKDLDVGRWYLVNCDNEANLGEKDSVSEIIRAGKSSVDSTYNENWEEKTRKLRQGKRPAKKKSILNKSKFCFNPSSKKKECTSKLRSPGKDPCNAFASSYYSPSDANPCCSEWGMGGKNPRNTSRKRREKTITSSDLTLEECYMLINGIRDGTITVKSTNDQCVEGCLKKCCDVPKGMKRSTVKRQLNTPFKKPPPRSPPTGIDDNDVCLPACLDTTAGLTDKEKLCGGKGKIPKAFRYNYEDEEYCEDQNKNKGYYSGYEDSNRNMQDYNCGNDFMMGPSQYCDDKYDNLGQYNSGLCSCCQFNGSCSAQNKDNYGGMKSGYLDRNCESVLNTVLRHHSSDFPRTASDICRKYENCPPTRIAAFDVNQSNTSLMRSKYRPANAGPCREPSRPTYKTSYNKPYSSYLPNTYSNDPYSECCKSSYKPMKSNLDYSSYCSDIPDDSYAAYDLNSPKYVPIQTSVSVNPDRNYLTSTRDFFTTEGVADTGRWDGQKITSLAVEPSRKNNIVTLNVPSSSDMTLKVPEGAYRNVTGGGLVKDINAVDNSNQECENSNLEGQNKLISVVYYNDKGSNEEDGCENAPTELLSLYYQGGSQNAQVPNQPLQIVISAKHVENGRLVGDKPGEEKAIQLLKVCQPNAPPQGITVTLPGSSVNRNTSPAEADMASNDVLLHLPKDTKLRRSSSSSTLS
ncbi:uncharacterized protein LOC106661257 isoform X2 [Cimex lectularius]|uniref:Uncharacterized protein n=1 Tax=Cimex lectularius TaxID=79782 RepID=A0A8I6SGQ1_CIMLE|nr:uncharacterized protein LOC106661257 isoform X2 [Cimex lectularius]